MHNASQSRCQLIHVFNTEEKRTLKQSNSKLHSVMVIQKQKHHLVIEAWRFVQ